MYVFGQLYKCGCYWLLIREPPTQKEVCLPGDESGGEGGGVGSGQGTTGLWAQFSVSLWTFSFFSLKIGSLLYT